MNVRGKGRRRFVELIDARESLERERERFEMVRLDEYLEGDKDSGCDDDDDDDDDDDENDDDDDDVHSSRGEGRKKKCNRMYSKLTRETFHRGWRDR